MVGLVVSWASTVGAVDSSTVGDGVGRGIGAGVGGLTAASLLLKAGFPVTVLEAHVYAGGSAGTFYHKGYRGSGFKECGLAIAAP